MASRAPPLIVSRYAIYDRIAAGGMATVHLGRLIAEGGFSRTVAIKRLHAHLALDPDFVSMFLDEARLAARIRHPNVVQTLDVVVADGEVFLVMEYVEGESLACLMRILTTGGEAVPPSHATALLAPVLHGLHAAHEAKTDQGEPLTMVHRDVSPQNVLVGTDGVPRVLDFGVAKALGQSHATRDGEIKGKLGYMSPEQIEGRPIDRRTDVFAASVVLWEALTGRRLFKAENDAQVMRMVIQEPSPPPSRFAPDVSPELDAIILCGLSKDPRYRFSTAEQMADALEETAPPIPTRKLATWVQGKFGDRLIARANLLKEIESTSGVVPPSVGAPAAPVDAAADARHQALFDEDAPTRIPSQSSSISVEAPPRPSAMPPRPSRVTPMAIIAGAGVCFGIFGLVAATRSSHPAPEAPALATTLLTPPSTAASQAASPVVPPPPPVVAAPTPLPPQTAQPPEPVTPEAPATAAAPPKPVATTRPAAPQPRPPAPRSPAPSSTLFSRF